MKKYISIVLVILFANFGLLPGAFAYLAPLAVYTWNPGDPGYNSSATIHTGIISTAGLNFGTLDTSTPPTGYGSSGVAVNWDDTWIDGGNALNGNDLDGLWVQHANTFGIWDLGPNVATNKVVVFTSQDHGPYLAEGLEYRVYGSNNLAGPWSSQATVTDVYLDGWRIHDTNEDVNLNGWCSDDISAVLQLDGTYRYIKVQYWSLSNLLNEPEIDAVAELLITVTIDIKPGSDPNSINLGSNGNVPVAILGSPTFDVTTVNPYSICLAGADVNLKGKAQTPQASYEDVNGDGFMDLIVQVTTQSLELSDGDTEAILTGMTDDGIPISGKDLVRIVPPV